MTNDKIMRAFKLLDDFTDRIPTYEDNQSADCCVHCHFRSGNYGYELDQGNKEENLHYPDCPYINAKHLLKEVNYETMKKLESI